MYYMGCVKTSDIGYCYLHIFPLINPPCAIHTSSSNTKLCPYALEIVDVVLLKTNLLLSVFSTH